MPHDAFAHSRPATSARYNPRQLALLHTSGPLSPTLITTALTVSAVTTNRITPTVDDDDDDDDDHNDDEGGRVALRGVIVRATIVHKHCIKVTRTNTHPLCQDEDDDDDEDYVDEVEVEE